MEGGEYHASLNGIVDEIESSLREEQDVASQCLQLQFKHGYLKNGNYNPGGFMALEYLSQDEPVVMTEHPGYRRWKVNARCDHPYFQRATANLAALAASTKCPVRHNHLLFVNWLDERFCFDCAAGEWVRMDKVALFKQHNLICRKKLFRLNFTRRIEYGQVAELVAQLSVKEWLSSDTFLRFKASTTYALDAHFFLECNTVYESQDHADYFEVERHIKQGADFPAFIKRKLAERALQTKDELELKLTPQGIELMRKGSLEAKRRLFSRAFDQIRDITAPPAEADITSMMAALTLHPQEEQKQQKEERKQEAKEERVGEREREKAEEGERREGRREYRQRERQA